MIVPVIDFKNLAQASEQQKLDIACRSHGFFALENHGITKAQRNEFFSIMAHYFSAPVDSKLQQERTVANPFGFYNKELTKNELDHKEVFDISLNGESKTLWPNDITFVEVATRWHHTCHVIAMKLLEAMFNNLALPLDSRFFTDHTSFLRLNYYPKFLDAENGSSNKTKFGVSHHTDAGALTVLCQDDIASLQFELDHQWHTAPAVDGQLLINLGDMLQVWSNDSYKAPLHRVLTNDQSDRYSAPYFLNPANSCNVAPLATAEPVYQTINWQTYRDGRASGDYEDLGQENQISDYKI